MCGAGLREGGGLPLVDLRDDPRNRLMPELAGIPGEHPAYWIREGDPRGTPEAGGVTEGCFE